MNSCKIPRTELTSYRTIKLPHTTYTHKGYKEKQNILHIKKKKEFLFHQVCLAIFEKNWGDWVAHSVKQLTLDVSSGLELMDYVRPLLCCPMWWHSHMCGYLNLKLN